ncbi:galactosylgalactosylxylosylprotein 3-beta-glucuronosyltransferase S [Eurytemora carolleeae]|uniref:galactosylgalactosylxylosylprotein 3-beta-glucuronosyltransferase S n=1 Tax=Eurytemora carolleeae TaxID=1294199 RepID=UPI000C75BF0C|nr:galactosylgalactosylxylosylprotein 3-beta-glucuronosyltransferase S [Eurytemora carolleeae]|eukprot:XP_023327196.1 galactosylgalactosylxylosylprotein 3-beta-glucuronosyltransferase S-like [Eurytemora affinis]
MGKQKLFLVLILGSASVFYIVFSGSPGFRMNAPIYPAQGVEQSTVCGSARGRHTPSTIFFITPTYPRREQIAELTRLGQTLLLADDLHWIVAEDSLTCSPLVADLLARLGIPFTHIASPQPDVYKESKFNPRGVSSRRAGLSWVLSNFNEGIIYFADDDNTYDIRLFKEISRTRKISMFPVGFIGGQGVSSPIVLDGVVVGFSDDWFAQRKFPVDMAGFAVNIDFIRSRNPRADLSMPYKAGYEEDYFIRSLKPRLTEIEPLADNCSLVLVWHTQTKKESASILYLKTTEEKTNLDSLLSFLHYSGMAVKGKHGKPVKSCYDGHQCKTNS